MSQFSQRYQSLFKSVFDKKLDNRGYVLFSTVFLVPLRRLPLTPAPRFYFSYDYDVSRSLQSNMGGLPRPIIVQRHV
jgi:hypothetical protein